MENEIINVNQPLSLTQVRGQVNLIQQIMKEVMQKDQHFGIIPGCKKPSLLKPGAEKLSMTFRLRPIIDNDRDIIIKESEFHEGHREVLVYCHIMNMSNVELATGVGSCSTMESKYRYRGGEKTPTAQPVPKKYWNLKKEEKMPEAQESIGGKGFGVMKDNGSWVICEFGEKMENPDIADTYNTVLKMAKKRAYVDGILSATGASDIFTQDVEDMPNEMVNKSKDTTPPSATKPEAEQPKSKSETNGDKISEAQSKRFFAICKTAGMEKEDMASWLLFYYELESSRDIPKSKYNEICEKAEKWKK